MKNTVQPVLMEEQNKIFLVSDFLPFIEIFPVFILVVLSAIFDIVMLVLSDP